MLAFRNGIFREVFEISSADRGTGNVHARTEQKIDIAGTGILSQALSELARKILVPGGSQGNTAGIGGCGSPGADAYRSVGHLEAG